MHADALGLPLTCSSAEAATAYVEAVDHQLHAWTGGLAAAQRALSLDQAARFTQCPKRMWRSMPCSRVVSFTYARIEGPSAIAFGFVHGLNLYPSVCMSESERMPG